jgi:DNA-binding transcriptional LysR family regulator
MAERASGGLGYPGCRQGDQGEGQIPFAELGNEVFILREPGSGTRIAVEPVFRERGTPLRVKMELGSNEAIKQAVAGGLGLAVISRSALSASGEGEGGELAELDVRGFPIRRHWYLVRPKGKQLAVVAQTFLEFLQDHVSLLDPH